MKILLPFAMTLLSLCCVLAGCQHTNGKIVPRSSSEKLTRNNCYSLLHQLLEQQKDVSILRFIKKENSDVKNLTKKIAVNSAAAAKLLEEFASHDPSIKLDDFRLPPGEVATREAIASTQQKSLLSQSGDEFELTLLLTLTQSLAYASHLATVASENNTHTDRVLVLTGISQDMEKLYQEVFQLLFSKTKFAGAIPQPKNP